MAFIEWDDSFSVEVEEIDEQHKGLVDVINDLHDAMSAGKGNEVLGDVFAKLMDYTVVHFNTEEKYFDEFLYEDSKEHKDEHKMFLEKVEGFKKGFDEGDFSTAIDVLHFLVDWFANHLKEMDQKYKECFKENGLK